MSVFAFAPVLAALALAAPQSIQVPRNDGWVTDLARVLAPNEERALESLCESYKAGSGHEIAVLTLADLGGQPIERFALEVGREWKIGRRGVDDGALVVVAKREREVRIEVGRALEGDLNDARAGRIIREVIVPRFRDGEYFEGLRDGLTAIHAALGGEYAAVETNSAGGSAAAPLATLFVAALFVALFVVLAIRAGRRGGRIRRWPGGATSLPHGMRGFGGGFGGSGGGGFSGFGGGGGFSGGGATGRW